MDSLFFTQLDNLSEKLQDDLSKYGIDGLKMSFRNNFKEITFYSKTSYSAKLNDGNVLNRGCCPSSSSSSTEERSDEKRVFDKLHAVTLPIKKKKICSNDKDALIQLYKRMYNQ